MPALARKRFGQHFLHDPAIVDRIVRAISPQPGETIVEIGPGRGVLTRALLVAAGRLDAVEIDRDLAARLVGDFPPGSGFELHVGDALAFDFAALAAARGTRLRIVGNLPYNISTPLLFHLLEAPTALIDMHVMLQREVIERMAAAPGSKAYGRLTVMLAPWARIEKLFDVGPGAFQPPPRVWSSVARISLRAQPAFEVPAGFAGLVASAFSQRRKTVRNALKSLLSAAEIEAAGVDPGARPEVIPPERFAALARAAARRHA
ncbi:MAG: 16S rRNA (adenine(1518)-N(6)/adenine(1519)-N(6))-dimethyltransferase RsmA [Steroidobacteraceae bacterium]